MQARFPDARGADRARSTAHPAVRSSVSSSAAASSLRRPGRRRLAVGLLAVSAALHAALLGWSAGLGAPAGASAAAAVPVQWIAPTPAIEPVAAARPAPSPTPRPAPRPEPGPTAVTPVVTDAPAASAVEAAPAPAVDQGDPGASPAAPADPPPAADGGGPPPGTVEGTAQASAGPAPPLYGEPLPRLEGTSRWAYRVYWGDYTDDRPIAALEAVVEADGRSYRMRTEGRAEGLLAWLYRGTFVQSSEGRLGPDGFEPERYFEQRGERTPRTAAIDRAEGRVRFGTGQQAPLAAGLQDRLTVVLQLSLLARAQAARFERGGSVTLPLLAASGIEAARFDSHGVETLELPAGPVSALRIVKRVAATASTRDATFEVWLDPARDMLPVRIRLGEINGRALDQIIAAR